MGFEPLDPRKNIRGLLPSELLVTTVLSKLCHPQGNTQLKLPDMTEEVLTLT